MDPQVLIAGSEHEHLRLDQFVAAALTPEYSRSQAARMIKAGCVTINGAPARAAATIHRGDEAKSVARDADMYYHLHVTDYFKSFNVVGVQEFNGRPCYHLKGVNNWGRINEHFYDQQNGLLLGYAFNTAWRGGKGDATETFEDYKDFGGVLMPTKAISRDGDDLAITLTTSVTYDDVDDSVFALPEAVKKAAAAKTNP